MIRLAVALVLILFAYATFATGGDTVGNGGGGICVGDKCSTLAESGLRVNTPDEPYYMLTPETTKALQSFADKIPVAAYKEDLIKQTLGSGNNYIKLDVVDPVKIEQIRKQYAKVLKDNNSSINPDDVRIFAFARVREITMGYYDYLDETYLLPDFFKLTPEQQAKVLIHERNVRGQHHEDFIAALELDGYIEDLSNDQDRLYKNNFRIERWFELLQKFYFAELPVSQLYADWIAWFKESKNIIFEAGWFCDLEMNLNHCPPNPAKISAHYPITPGFLRFLTTRHSDDMWYKGPIDLGYDNWKPYAAEVTKLCYENLGSEQEKWFLYPFRFYGVDYHLTLVKCSRYENREFEKPLKVEAYMFEYK